MHLVPKAFDTWVNLKDDSFFKRVYNVSAYGGLENCCKNIVKVDFEGRAHSGLTDARNTAAIAADMANNLFRFTRPSRGFDKNGRMYGSTLSKKKQELEEIENKNSENQQSH